MTIPLLLLACLLAACGGNKKDHNTMVFGRGSDSVGLDPGLETDGESFKVCDNIYETLVGYDSESTSVVPQLAHSWDVSADQLTWTFHLRRGVQFHDGTPFDADAMLFSLGRQFYADHPFHEVEGGYKYWRDMGMDEIIGELTAPNDSTFVIRLKEANAPFLSNLAMNFCAAVSPTALKKFGRDYFKNPVGTGPFRFVEWRKDERIVLARNDDYWGPKAKLDRLIFKPIQEASIRFLELSQNSVQGLDNLSPEYIDEIRANSQLQLMTQPGMNVGYLAMNMEKAPFDDLRVRQAINHAVNKKALVDNFYQGLAMVAKNPIPPTLWGYNDDIAGYAYDPDKARALLAEAGFANGFATELWAMPVPRPYMPQPDKIAQALQADLAKVGIRARIVQWEWGTYLDKVFAGEHPMALLGWTGDNGDPDNFLYVLLDKTSAIKPAQNIAFYKSDQLHEILVAARHSADRTERTQLYRQAQEIIFRDAPWVPLVHATQTMAFHRAVRGFKLHPTGSKWFHSTSLAP